MSPLKRMPPSAMTGMSYFVRRAPTASRIAVSCGTPMPATMRVVQIEPGPMPTLTPSTPASARSLAAAAVATLPAITSTGSFCFRVRTVSSTFVLWPWAVSTTSTSTPASTRPSARS